MADPFAQYLPRLPTFQQPGNEPEPIQPEEEKGWLGKTVGGVQWLGETLGKAGAAERGVLSGLSGGTGEQAGWAGLKNLIPFSDTLGITDPTKRISGSDLLEQWGMPKTGHESFDWTQPYDWVHAVAGLGTEIATDPLVQFGAGIGGLTGKGVANASKGIESVVKTPVTIGQQLADGERALLSGHVPFTDIRFGLGKGEAAKKLWEEANYNALSPMRYIRGLWSEKATGADELGRGGATTFDRQVQRWNDMHYAQRQSLMGQYQSERAVLAVEGSSLQKTFEGLASRADETGDVNFSNFMRSVREDYGDKLNPEIINERMTKLMGFTPATPHDALEQTAAFAGELHNHMENVISFTDKARDMAKSLGYDVAELQDQYSEWLVRHAPALRGTAAAKYGTAIGDTEHKLVNREPALKNLPTGTELPNRIISDKNAMGFTDPAAESVSLLNGKDHVEQLQKWAKTMADDPAAPAADRLRLATLANDPKAKLADLQELYVQQNHIKPALEKAWGEGMPTEGRMQLDAEGKAVLDDAGKPVPMTLESEQARWLTPNSEPTRALMNELNGIMAKVSHEKGDIGELARNGLFSQSYLKDVFQYTNSLYRKAGVMSGAHNLLTQEGAMAKVGDKAAEAWPTLQDAWTNAKLMPEGLETWVKTNKAQELADALKQYVPSPEEVARQQLASKGITDPGAIQQLLPQLVQSAPEPPAGAMQKAMADVLENLRVNPSAAKALRAFNWAASDKTENVLLKGYDKLNSFLKSMLYSVWPASHGRDFFSHTFMIAQDGSLEPANLAKLPGYYLDHYKFALGKGLKDETGNGFLQEFINTSDSAWSKQDVMHEAIPGTSANVPGGGLGWVVGGPFKEAAQSKEALKQGLNPFAAPGFAEAGKFNIPQTIGMRAQQLQMFVQQSAFYRLLREQEMSPAAALYKVKQVSMSPELTSQFDKDVMKRLVPFWNFYRRNVPYQLSRLAESPGGIGGQTMQAMSRIAGQGHPSVYTPSFLQENMAYPVGEDNPQAQAFFRNSIIPFNDLNDLVFKGGTPAFGRTLEKIVSRANPMLLAGPELAAGRQFATGRSIGDLESGTKAVTKIAGKLTGAPEGYEGTAVPGVDRLLHYSPVSRVLGETIGALDPRKTWPQVITGMLGTGHVSDYDTEAWKIRDMRDAMGESLKSQPEVKPWTSYFIPKSEQEKMDPEQLTKVDAVRKDRQRMIKLLGSRIK